MTDPERNVLAHEIAEDDSKCVIESNSVTAESDGASWYQIHPIDDLSSFHVARAVRYLEAEGILKRAPSNPNLIGWDEDGADEAE